MKKLANFHGSVFDTSPATAERLANVIRSLMPGDPADQVVAQKRLQRLRRYGSHRVKVAVRRHSSKSPAEALQAVKDTLVGRLVVRDIRQAVKKARWPSTKRYKGAWIKDEWS